MSTWPRPSSEDLAAIYATPDYYGERAMTDALEDEARARAGDLLGRIGGGPLLDYGAGNGYLVHGARALGVEAEGVEPSAAGRRIAHDLYGVELMDALPGASDGGYQGITLLHVLEHVPDPVGLLRGLGEALAPGGKILIEVPHAGGIRYLKPSERRLYYDLPAHLYHFTPRTLSEVVGRVPLTVESVRLFNPWFLERLLARRRARPRAETGATDPDGAAGANSGGPGRAAWHTLLPLLRERVPGGKFEMVVSRP